MIVVADTSPINDLALIDHIDLVRRLYGEVLIPTAVLKRTEHPHAPESVRLRLARLFRHEQRKRE